MPHANRASEHIQCNRTNCENAQSAQNFALRPLTKEGRFSVLGQIENPLVLQ